MRVVAVIPAYRNAASIADTIGALRPKVHEVIVVDDASPDDTSARAAAAGAKVIRLPRNLGKGGALEAGLSEVGESDVLLMVDGDTGASAAAAIDLLGPIEEGHADMVVGILPPAGKQGGFGTVKNLAVTLVRLVSGFDPISPLSGQRAIRVEVLRMCLPLAHGFGVDAALTADAVVRGFKVIEQHVVMTHDHRGRSAEGFAHRGRQGFDLILAFAPRLVRRVLPSFSRRIQ